MHWRKKKQKTLKHQQTLTVLATRTGFPVSTLEDFAKRGLLPEASKDKVTGQARFDGMALLRHLGEIEDAD